MKIAFIGEFTCPEGYSYASSFVATLIRLGHTVTTFDSKKLWWTPWRNYEKSGRIEKCIHQKVLHYKLLSSIQNNFDLVWILKGENLWWRTIKKLKKNNPSTLFLNFFPDNPFLLANGNSSADLIKSMGFYDHWLSWSQEFIPILQATGCKNIHYFPFGFDPHYYPQPNLIPTPKTIDYCFIGTWDKEREDFLENLVTLLPSYTGEIWGNGWDEKIKSSHKLYPFIKGKALYGASMASMFQTSKIVLNMIRTQNGSAHNMRTMEIPATKSFQLTNNSYEQTELLFVQGHSIESYSTLEEAAKKIRFFCSHEAEREAIATAGYKAVQQFTLDILITKLFDEIKKKD